MLLYVDVNIDLVFYSSGVLVFIVFLFVSRVPVRARVRMCVCACVRVCEHAGITLCVLVIKLRC